LFYSTTDIPADFLLHQTDGRFRHHPMRTMSDWDDPGNRNSKLSVKIAWCWRPLIGKAACLLPDLGGRASRAVYSVVSSGIVQSVEFDIPEVQISVTVLTVVTDLTVRFRGDRIVGCHRGLTDKR